MVIPWPLTETIKSQPQSVTMYLPMQARSIFGGKSFCSRGSNERFIGACHAGFRSTRRTKIICTIGPGSSSPEILQTLAEQGMNVARLNMGHGTQDWHKNVIDRIRKLNRDKG